MYAHLFNKVLALIQYAAACYYGEVVFLYSPSEVLDVS